MIWVSGPCIIGAVTGLRIGILRTHTGKAPVQGRADERATLCKDSVTDVIAMMGLSANTRRPVLYRRWRRHGP
jgi:hypothetical protein